TCSYCTQTFATSAQKDCHFRVPTCKTKCEQCNEEFACEADLFVHNYTYHDKQNLVEQFPSLTIEEKNVFEELQCPICQNSLPATTMEHHLQEKHFSEESYSCCVCKSYFKTSSCLKTHLGRHFNKQKRETIANEKASIAFQRPIKKPKETENYPCKHCGEKFQSISARNHHKKVPPLNLQCPKCPTILKSQASMIVHNFQVHEQHLLVKTVKGDVSRTNRSLYCCPLCSKPIVDLKKHISSSHVDEMTYQCCVCGKKFSSSATLQKHCDDHALGKRGTFQCSKCPMVTHSHSDFFKHAATHRSQCEFCKIEFGHPHLLWPHYMSQHADELYTCEQCGKKIATKTQLATHMRYHRFQHIEPCPKCGIMIRGNLKKHLYRKHPEKPDTEENVDGQTSTSASNNHRCFKCFEWFPTRQSLIQHRQSHNRKSIPCPTCNKTFSTKTILTTHIDRVHLKISSYICDICGKKATSSYNLKVHKRIHSSTKLFTCDVCDQGFNYKASLQGHMRSKHGSATVEK
ncbi:hypothetical protein EGW08_018373, partial [Elysia chlorotica]